MITTKLEMFFKTEAGKSFKIFVNDPDQDLEKEDIMRSMDSIVEEDAFQVDEKSLLASHSAQLVTRKVDKLF